MANRFGFTKKEDVRGKAEALLLEYNDAVQKGNFAPTIEVPKSDEVGNPVDGTENVLIREIVEQLVNEYTSISRNECFAELKKSEDPMYDAVKQLTFPTIFIADEKVGEEKKKIPVSVIKDTEKPIDLLKLHKFVGGDGIGKDKGWHYKIEKLNFLLTAWSAERLGIDPKTVNDSYAMSEISKAVDLGKTPTSNTNMLKTVQIIVTAMIGEDFKATSHDVEFLKMIYNKKNRAALTVSCANHKYMRQYMAEICHRIVTEKTYKLDYKKNNK